MPKELVISAAPHETRVAILEDGLLCEIYIEREKEFALVGSIYKGRVTRVLPGMQSAFVEIGLDSDAFLYVGDFLENLEDYDHVVTPVETKIEKMEQQGGAVFAPSSAAPAGDGSPSADGMDAAAPASGGQDAQPPSTDAAPGSLDAEEPGDRQPNFAQTPNSAPRSGAPQQFNRQDRGNDRGGQDRGRGGRRGGRGGRWNRGSGGSGGGGNRGNDRRPPAGRDLPQAKYASPRPLAGRPYEAPPATAQQEEMPSDYTPVILPGESLAKYKDRGASSSSSSSSSPSAASSAPSHGGGSHGGGSQSGLPASLYAAPGQVDTPAPREEFVAPASEMLEAVVIPQPALQQPDVHVASHGAHGDLSEDEISALTEQLAEARHEEAHAEAEASAGTSMLGEEVPPAPAGNSEAEEFRAEADAQEREDALSASAEGIEAGSKHEAGSEHEVGSENEDEQEHDDELAVEAEANEGSTSADMEAADGTEGDVEGDSGPDPRNVEQSDAGASSNRQPGFNPTSARVSQPNRARFQRPARRGGRPQRGNRPHRQHDQGHGQSQQAARRPQLISEMLKAGQEIIVQIAKEPLGKKGARITSHVALPGRFLVYMPTVNHIGVSRRIASADERSRLRRLVGESKATFPGGFIVRTAAEGAPDDEIRADVEFLGRTWEKIRTQSEPRKAPSLLHRDLNLVERILRDYVSNDYTAIWIDNQEEYSKVVEFVGRFQPKLVSRVKLYTKPAPIFEEFGIQQELDKALRPKVWLKSGGYIVINHTEALVAIDVNTGKYVGRGGTRLEDTIVKTNLEAVKEIVRQIRLRDLGGIIVLDFIDMEERRNRDKVMAALDSALRADRAPSKALSFNEFGLVAVTRKRTKQALERVLCQPCPYCTGSGMVKSVPTICYEIQAEARKMAPELDSSTLTLRAHPEIAKALKTREASLIEELEQGTRKSVIIQADPTLHWEQYDIY